MSEETTRPNHSTVHKQRTLLIILLFVVVGLFGAKIGLMYRDLNVLETQQDDLLSKYNMCFDLYQNEQNKTKEVQNSLDTLYEDYLSLDTQYTDLTKTTNEVIGKIDEYQTEIADSMEWFRSNAELDTTQKMSSIKRHIQKNCFLRDESGCHLKTACLYLTNDNHLELTYKNDTTTTGELDKLGSLHDFINNQGGDCEDYSLFFKAQWNHLIGKCEDSNAQKIFIEAWTPTDSGGQVWADFGDEWYLPNSVGYIIQNNIYPNIICGRMYDLNTNTYNGHCMIAFTTTKITNELELFKLNKAPVIEPQNGRFMGYLNDESSNIYVLDEGYVNREAQSYVYQVITDNDLLLYSFQNDEWNGYQTFSDELAKNKQDIEDYIAQNE